MTQVSTLRDVYQTLLDTYGPRNWWPADTSFEVMLGAILTQNTAWSNVERAIASLKTVVPLEPEQILGLDEETLQDAIRPSGYFRQKARRLRLLCLFIIEKYDGDVAGMEGEDTEALRSELLGLNGIGPETADSILLYALDRPVFVIDAYTVRLLDRLGLLEGSGGYNEVQELFTESMEPDTKMYNEYHALIVMHGKERCRKKAPLCEGCCLKKCPRSHVQRPTGKGDVSKLET
ncbi:MAG TPA: endonuclease III domain-containing protein [Proteobacteria bacterium]|nr:endonuclease III [bacterium BMS3Abin14]HDL53187.1 endonuclease III domain-containing protein [Pseudomonadota bacterium]